MSHAGKFKVAVQGMDRSLKYTGSFNEVELGALTAEEVVSIIKHVSSIKYPPGIDFGESSPIAVHVEGWDATLSMYYNGEGKYNVRIIDDRSRTDNMIAENVGEDTVVDFIRRFFRSRHDVEELMGSPESREYLIPIAIRQCYEDYCSDKVVMMPVSKSKIFWLEPSAVKSIIVKRGGFMKSPKIIIEYYDRGKGKWSKKKLKLADKKYVEWVYQVLNYLHSRKVKLE